MDKNNKSVENRVANLKDKMNPVDIAGIGVSNPYPKIDFDKVDALLLWTEKNLKNDVDVFATYLDKLENLSEGELRWFNKKQSVGYNALDIDWEV